MKVERIAEVRTEAALRTVAQEIVKETSEGKKSKNVLSPMQEAAESLGVEIEAIQAVAQVESAGDGFLRSGRPRMLFEGHVFWRQLLSRGLPADIFSDEENEDILYPNWTRKYYLGRESEYTRLDRAKEINEKAALESASWGAYQIMGYHWKSLGYESIKQFVDFMYMNEEQHLKAFVRYIDVNGLKEALRDKDWVRFARAYNGPGFAHNDYDGKMRRAYESFVKENKQ